MLDLKFDNPYREAATAEQAGALLETLREVTATEGRRIPRGDCFSTPIPYLPDEVEYYFPPEMPNIREVRSFTQTTAARQPGTKSYAESGRLGSIAFMQIETAEEVDEAIYVVDPDVPDQRVRYLSAAFYAVVTRRDGELVLARKAIYADLTRFKKRPAAVPPKAAETNKTPLDPRSHGLMTVYRSEAEDIMDFCETMF